jgi:hypothetical protein
MVMLVEKLLPSIENGIVFKNNPGGPTSIGNGIRDIWFLQVRALLENMQVRGCLKAVLAAITCCKPSFELSWTIKHRPGEQKLQNASSMLHANRKRP